MEEIRHFFSLDFERSQSDILSCVWAFETSLGFLRFSKMYEKGKSRRLHLSKLETANWREYRTDPRKIGVTGPVWTGTQTSERYKTEAVQFFFAQPEFHIRINQVGTFWNIQSGMSHTKYLFQLNFVPSNFVEENLSLTWQLLMRSYDMGEMKN